MAAGIQVFNDSGTLQIDETYSNLFLHKKAAVTTTVAGLFSTSIVDVTIANCRYIPLVFLNCASYAAVRNISMSGTTATARVIVAGPVGTPLTYYAFDRSPNTPAADYGLQVFDAAGNITFDALRSPMRVVDYYTVAGNTGETRTYPTGKTYAAAATGGSWLFPTGGGGGGPAAFTIQYQGARISGNTVSVGPFQVFSDAGGATSQIRTGHINVIDVTNY